MGGGRLDFEIDDKLETRLLTAHAGDPGLIEAFRQTGAEAVIDREVQIKRRKCGLCASEMVESLMALWATGGERTEDLDRLRGDDALALLLGHALPAAQTTRDFLAQFHQDALPMLKAGDAPVPGESAPFAMLGKANAELVLDLQARRPVGTATLDVDATIIDSDKRAAKRTFEGGRGYQPLLVLWAEQDVIVADEFRDGNVPAGCGNRRVVEKAIAALPPGIGRIRLRGDSALYEHELLRWLAARGIEYAISADMRERLAACIAASPEAAWRPDHEDRHAMREWAEVAHVSSDGIHRRGREPRRTIS